mgnify:CR=1 FL=1
MPFTWGGVTFSEGGTINDTLTDSHGCDSVVVKTLTVLPPSAARTIERYDTICQGETGYHVTREVDTLLYEDFDNGTPTCWSYDNAALNGSGFNALTGYDIYNIPNYYGTMSALGGLTLFEYPLAAWPPEAENLIGNGDMLFVPNGMKSMRVQGAWVSDDEVNAVVEYIKERHESTYDEDMVEQINNASVSDAEREELLDEYDPRLPEAIDIVIDMGQASISMLQRKLKLGYSRASRLVDQMEERGYVGPFNGSKPREILITKQQWQEMKMKINGGAADEELPEFDRAGTIRDVFDSHDGLD